MSDDEWATEHRTARLTLRRLDPALSRRLDLFYALLPVGLADLSPFGARRYDGCGEPVFPVPTQP